MSRCASEIEGYSDDPKIRRALPLFASAIKIPETIKDLMIVLLTILGKDLVIKLVQVSVSEIKITLLSILIEQTIVWDQKRMM